LPGAAAVTKGNSKAARLETGLPQTATPIADQQQGGAMLYVLPADPASPLVSLPNLRSRAKRRGYRISYDRNTGAFTLVDSHLRRPIVGLEHVGLPEIANAIEATRRGQ
jgi:hypothetical protein